MICNKFFFDYLVFVHYSHYLVNFEKSPKPVRLIKANSKQLIVNKTTVNKQYLVIFISIM